MTGFTPREKELLHLLFAPGSINRLVKLFPKTTEAEWESIYSKLLDRGSTSIHLVLYVDGASDPEKGTAGIGGVIYLTNKDGNIGDELFTFSENIGKATNNVAEYRALIQGLKYAKQLNGKQITVYSDSELVVKQLNLDYKVKSDKLIKLHTQAANLLNKFELWSVQHIPRSKNRKADILSSNALKKRKEDK